MDYTSTQKVLDLPELLEIILLACPIRTVLTAQRVSTSFRDMAAFSPKLQRYLFLAPTSTELLGDFSYDEDVDVTGVLSNLGDIPMFTPSGRQFLLNPLLPHVWSHSPPVSFIGLSSLVVLSLSQEGNDTHSLDKWTLTTHGPASLQAPNPVISALKVEMDASFKLDSDRVSLHYPEASWRRMFLTQPPSRANHPHSRWPALPRLELDLGGVETLRRLELDQFCQSDPNYAARGLSPSLNLLVGALELKTQGV